MFFEASKLSEFRLESLVGGRSEKLVKGSASMFVKSAEGTDLAADLIGAKASFEIRQKGLLIYLSKSDKRWVFALPAADLEEIIMQGGEETHTAARFTPMGIMLKLGISIRYARNYETRHDEYDVTPIELTLKSKELNLHLETSGYNNYRLRDFVATIEKLI